MFYRDTDTGLINRKTGGLVCSSACGCTTPCFACDSANKPTPAYLNIFISGFKSYGIGAGGGFQESVYVPSGTDSINGLHKIPYYVGYPESCLWDAKFCGDYGRVDYYDYISGSWVKVASLPVIYIGVYYYILELMVPAGSYRYAAVFVMGHSGGTFNEYTVSTDYITTAVKCINEGEAVVSSAGGRVDTSELSIKVYIDRGCQIWNAHTYYTLGKCVKLSTASDGFYVCLVPNMNKYPPGNPTYWQYQEEKTPCGRINT